MPCPVCGLFSGSHSDEPLSRMLCPGAMVESFRGHRAARDNIPAELLKEKGWQNR